MSFEKMFLPKDSLSLYRAGKVLETASISLKKYNLFTYINSSCASCLSKFEILNDLFSEVKARDDISFYCLCYSEDNFELLKFLVEEGKIKMPKYDVLLDSIKLQDNPVAFSRLNTTVVTDSNLNILYCEKLLDNPLLFRKLLKSLP